MRRLGKRLVGVLGYVLAIGLSTLAHAAAPLPGADFFRNPVITSVVMSPNGLHVAAAMAGGPQGRRRLVVLDLQDWSKSKLLAAFGDADVQAIHWVNDDRLVFTLTDAQSPYAAQTGQGLYAVDHDGKTPPRRLISRRWSLVSEPSSRRELDATHHFYGVLRDGSTDVLVEQWNPDGRYRVDSTSLWRLDTLNAGMRLLTPNAPAHAKGWAVDGQGLPRVAVSSREGKTRIYWKTTADGAWSLQREIPSFQFEAPVLLGVDREDQLYMVDGEGGAADTTALLRLNLRAPDAKPHVMLRLEGHDFSGSLLRAPGGRLLGVRYAEEERGTHWFDARLKQIQAAVDKLLPDTNNLLDCGDCAQPRVVLVSATSDRQPGTYLLYDVQAGTLKAIATARPWIKPAAMAERSFLRIAARDGLSLPLHLTRPLGSTGPAPMVVLVHGGPWARAAGWVWDAPSQFLGSRGYLVVEPEFRSSLGYGSKLFRAGFKQWGLTMQDDVADAARWAIAQGLADPKRVCIAGASYGGYATLMGLIRDPQLFRCGVAWVGVTDLELQFASGWGSRISDEARDFDLPVVVGDPDKDAARFAAVSPLRLAAKLRQPLLMAYGGLDEVVDIEQGTKMRKALAPTNPDVEWIEYADEGHGWMLEANRIDFWRRVETFLARHLRAAP